MWHTNKSKTLLSAIFCLMALNFYGQTFSVISDTTVTSYTPNVIVLEDCYLTISSGYDTIGTELIQPLIIQKYDLSGELILHRVFWDSLWIVAPLADANFYTNDTTIFFAAEKYYAQDPEVITALCRINSSGDTLNSHLFSSPYYQSSQELTNWNRPVYITSDIEGNLYLVNRVVDYPPIQNNFIIRKIDSEGEVLWTYINPINTNYYSCNTLQLMSGKLWFNLVGFYNRLQSLDIETGVLLDDITLNGEGYNLIQANDAILDQSGITVASILFNEDFEILPSLYRMDYDGNLVWVSNPIGEYKQLQANNHLVQSGDGGFVSCGEKYDEEPSWLYPNDPAMNNTMKRIWLWKVDADGNFLWQRFYAYYDFDYSEEYFHLTNIAHDMKATPDGGFIMAGEASASCTNYPTCDEFTQQGWLLKVDGCGCLVPGCDPGCIVGVEEIAAEDEIKYFRFGPNPVSDLLNLYIPSLSIPMNELNFSLYDNLGRKVNDFQFKFDDTTYMIDASNLASGEYILSLSHNGQIVQTEKVVKK